MEIRSFRKELRTTSENGLQISGYAAVFYDPADSGTQFMLDEDIAERIMPGAFDRALKERQDIVGLFNHDADNVLGRTSANTMTLTVDSKGLRYNITLADTQYARDLSASISRGDIAGSSFSFVPTRQSWSEDPLTGLVIREIHDVNLIDVGPVTFPAYESTETESYARSQDRNAARKEAQQVRKQRFQPQRDAMAALLSSLSKELA